MKIETQMIQNSIFTFKRTDEQNGSLHQHKSTFVVIDYYQGFKVSFLRLILREFKRKKPGRFGWTTPVRSSKWRQRHSPEADFNKIYDKPAYKTKNAVTDTQYIRQSVHTYGKLLNNQSLIASICPFFVLHQLLLHANQAKRSLDQLLCDVTLVLMGRSWANRGKQ